ncbi:hypothetical protein [Streptomyces zaehneri]|uniref:hypothetical protein n=1 Tax=Streptomyces zaehneri TaxID=3051180 RepID=UPI0028D5E4CD|nr:hypothetical protein [Streptomyces sp. DSM 40713]
MATPTTHERTAEITSRAGAEARSMAGTGPGHAHRPRRDPLAAAALRTHGRLSAGLRHSAPLPALGPTGATVHALAAFLAVYAAQDPDAPTTGRDRHRRPDDRPATHRGEDGVADTAGAGPR